jgi:hypothetical protein
MISTAGPSCSGWTVVGGLSETAGSSTQTCTLDTTSCAWTYDEDRTIVGGNWTLSVDVTCGGGGGPNPRVDIAVSRRNSSCVVQTTLLSCAGIDVTKSATTEATCGPTSNSSEAFGDTDMIHIDVNQTRGTVTCTADYNNSTAAADSRLVHPGITTLRRAFVVGK